MIEIGVEVKIFAKAMIKQIGRVKSDMKDQVDHFRKGSGAAHAICVGLVGVNHAEQCTSYEKAAVWTTDGSSGFRHPSQEAPEVIKRLTADTRPLFDELLFLPYRATNVDPYPFDWVAYDDVAANYGALLVRVSREYEQRFDGHAPPQLNVVQRERVETHRSASDRPQMVDRVADYVRSCADVIDRIRVEDEPTRDGACEELASLLRGLVEETNFRDVLSEDELSALVDLISQAEGGPFLLAGHYGLGEYGQDDVRLKDASPSTMNQKWSDWREILNRAVGMVYGARMSPVKARLARIAGKLRGAERRLRVSKT